MYDYKRGPLPSLMHELFHVLYTYQQYVEPRSTNVRVMTQRVVDAAAHGQPIQGFLKELQYISRIGMKSGVLDVLMRVPELSVIKYTELDNCAELCAELEQLGGKPMGNYVAASDSAYWFFKSLPCSTTQLVWFDNEYDVPEVKLQHKVANSILEHLKKHF